MTADHHHAHSHGHQNSGRSLIWSFALTLGFAVVEGIGGVWADSLALLGDAGHMVSDATSLGLAALAAWVARHPPSARHSYGLGRAEVVAAIERVITVATANAKFAGLGGDRDVARQVDFIRKGVKFMTTQTDIGFLMAEASRRTSELRTALAQGAP